jgi:hypothetical protein
MRDAHIPLKTCSKICLIAPNVFAELRLEPSMIP